MIREIWELILEKIEFGVTLQILSHSGSNFKVSLEVNQGKISLEVAGWKAHFKSFILTYNLYTFDLFQNLTFFLRFSILDDLEWLSDKLFLKSTRRFTTSRALIDVNFFYFW